ncbi:MAG: NfeD family protein [Verrucomicrobiota bacterium]
MKALLRVMLAGILMAGAWNGTARAAEVVVIPIQGEISQARFFFLRRALKEAQREEARAIVLDMDTYGGELTACVQMQKALAQVKLPTLAYINPNAGSAGALIAISTQRIYMAPISAIGAAAPVLPGGQDLGKTIEDKTISYYSDYFASVAKENGHNPDIARAFINKDKAVVVGGQTLHEKGSVLTLSAQDAVKLIDGKPVLAAGIASSIPDLLSQAKLGGTWRRVEPTGFEMLAFWITTLAPLFLLGGILGAYLEFKMPGTGLPAIAALLCFGIFFLGHYIAGLAGWEAPVLFLLGLALVLGELFIHPGTILPGLTGAALMVAAILWAMVDRYPGAPLLPEPEALLLPLAKLGIAVGLAAAMIAVLAKYLPKASFFRGLVLATRQPSGAALPIGKSEFTRLSVGAEGVARSILRPSGKAEFGGELYDVITAGQFVDPGVRVRVAAVEGARIIVEPV